MNQQDYIFDYSNILTANSSIYSTNIYPTKYQSELITFDQQLYMISLLDTSSQELAIDFCSFESIFNNSYGDLIQTNAGLDSSVYDFYARQSIIAPSTSSEVNVASPSGTANWPSCPSSPTPDIDIFQSLNIPFSDIQTINSSRSNSSSRSSSSSGDSSSNSSNISNSNNNRNSNNESNDINRSNMDDFRPVLPSGNIDKSEAHCHPLYEPYYSPSNKPFSCHVCPRSFARKHDLHRHIRVHTGDKPYLCVNCFKTFARTDALKRHLRIEDACRLSPVVQAMKERGSRRYRNL